MKSLQGKYTFPITFLVILLLIIVTLIAFNMRNGYFYNIAQEDKHNDHLFLNQ